MYDNNFLMYEEGTQSKSNVLLRTSTKNNLDKMYKQRGNFMKNYVQ